MDGDLANGTLGPMFERAEILTIPQVKTTLYEKMEDLRHRSSSFEASTAFQTMQATMRIAEVLQDFCASDADVHRLKKRKLRLRDGGVDGENAHLRNLQFDDDGNVIVGEDATGFVDDADGAVKRASLKPFELVQLATLMPTSVEEAIALIPSLAVYNEEDLRNVMHVLSASL
jgi:uncharacterized protein YdcH (DUF465 family)